MRQLMRESLASLVNHLIKEGKIDEIPALRKIIPQGTERVSPNKLPKRPQLPQKAVPSDFKVCIVGSGMAGLYSALILDHLGIPYDILEAASRPGGRILTHYFSTKPHDYYDIGAMRFPKIPPMERTFDLFRRTGVPLIDYKLSGPGTPKRYNGRTIFKDQGPRAVEDDPFHLSESNGGPVPDKHIAKGSEIMEEAWRPLKEAIKSGNPMAYAMFKKVDHLTVREYLRDKMKLDFHTIQWLEQTDSATGLFDLAYTEGVLDTLAFDYGPEEEEWKSVEGGTNLVTEALVDMIKHKPIYNKRVTRIALDRNAAGEGKMIVTTNYNEEPRRYASVINTTTLACLHRMDITDLELSATVKMAFRALRYDSATKVAIKFDKPWWITKFGVTAWNMANTDLPIRVCVYPSYNFNDDPNKPAVLLCTYTWAQDAQRIGSLVNLDSPHGDEELKGLMLYNLARLHSDEKSFDKVYDMIKRSYITHHGFDWAMDDCSSGAYAFFGPGQFRSLYPHLIRPHSDSRFHIAGEAASANHAWVVGSLESAYRSVWMILERFQCFGLQQKMAAEFGTIVDIESGEDGYVHLLNIMGQLRPEQLAKMEKEEENATASSNEDINRVIYELLKSAAAVMVN